VTKSQEPPTFFWKKESRTKKTNWGLTLLPLKQRPAPHKINPKKRKQDKENHLGINLTAIKTAPCAPQNKSKKKKAGQRKPFGD